MLIIHVVGARPNFMKVAPVMAALAETGKVSQLLVHTGQHYDANMSDIFFHQLGLPHPDINMGVGTGSHAVQVAQIMMRFEEIVLQKRPDWVCIYGDVNSTLAAALVCAKLLIPIAHIEAGLRSLDRTMPEEVNRLLTDQVSDLLFTPSTDGDQNLIREGIASDKIHFVGNVMIDTLQHLLPKAEEKWAIQSATLGVKTRAYALITLHRPSNVDNIAMLKSILAALNDIQHQIPVIFPIHPRTRLRIESNGMYDLVTGMHLIEPLGYLEFLALQKHAAFVITDSGGVQEETTYLGVPCLTVRENTERPVTVTLGTNTLVGHNMTKLRQAVDQIFSGHSKQGTIPPLWDGKSGKRIAKIMLPTS